MLTQEQVEQVVDLLTTVDENTRVYFGCDSVRFKRDGRFYARYAAVVVVHMNGRNGCRIFSHVSTEPDYDLKKNRPKMRMMNEVAKVCELYNQLAPFVDEFDVEIHIDVNRDEKHGSNCALSEATGYVLAMTGIEPKCKPDAWCASFGADAAAHSRV